jgi:hypothetical protein
VLVRSIPDDVASAMETTVAVRCREDRTGRPPVSTSGSDEPHCGQNPIHFEER